ncbi:EAL domain-containing protein [Uliginosibacterium sp. H3]|uniref:EAL domain-containing protein n=1 Tax=Uliginosibacterium silvisoli TaxID=3114758 RepID=A0ABU6K1B0_9RHOO|nr:EAL domain-containing protein [Uliginosibacterium sp. H3]
MQALYLAALADLTLSGLIFVIWRVRPGDRHALYWSFGFASMAGGVALIGHSISSQTFYAPVLSAALIAVGLSALWGGTRWRLGKPQSLLQLGLVSAALFAPAGLSASPLREHIVVAEMASVFLWCGGVLWLRVPGLRLAALTFIARAVFVAAFLVGRKPGTDDPFLYLAILARGACALGLIHNLLSEAMQQWKASEALRRSGSEAASARLASVIESLSDSIYVRDATGRIVMANSACARMLGRSETSEVIGHSVSELIPGMTEEFIGKENADVLGRPDGNELRDETELKRHDDVSFPVERRVSRFHIDDGLAAGDGVLVQMRDLTERKQYEDKLVQQVTVDEITQLPNRRMLMDRLHQALAMARRGGTACAVMLIDLDHFKRINETRGHTLGDALLARAAQRLRNTMREADTVARFGGDEFVVVLTEADPVASPLRVEYAAQRVVEAFQHPFVFDEMQVVTTASVGIAVWPVDGDDADTLVRNADTAMYEIKKSTRNGFCLFNREMNVRVQNILRIDAQLRGALDRQQLRVVFQPIVDATTHRMMKVEALLRWRSATLGDVPPDQFIPVAEETGQINVIGAWVLEESCRKLLQLQAMRQDGAPLTMSVNVSARQLVEPDFASTVDAILARTGMPPGQLELELTERILIDDNPAVLETIAQLRKRGISLSLDDFGTGYSSLSYLTRFALNTIKLDRSFVRDIGSNPQSLDLATAVIAMCRSLGLALVAEGVESADQADLLRQRGCRFLQGYYFGRPVSADEVASVSGFQRETIAG